MNVVIKPLISEKMTRITEAAANPKVTRIQRNKLSKEGKTFEPVVRNRYAFVVNKDANKIEIRKAVESFYGVRVMDLNTMNYSGKQKSRETNAGYNQGRTNAFKKAVVTLAPGNSIDFYSEI